MDIIDRLSTRHREDDPDWMGPLCLKNRSSVERYCLGATSPIFANLPDDIEAEEWQYLLSASDSLHDTVESLCVNVLFLLSDEAEDKAGKFGNIDQAGQELKCLEFLGKITRKYLSPSTNDRSPIEILFEELDDILYRVKRTARMSP